MLLAETDGVEIVGQAASARRGIELTQRLNPEVVTLDIRMPGKSGIDALAEIKGSKPTPSVSMLTNYPYPAYRQRCLELGADFFFDKSKGFGEACETVRDLVHASD